MGPSAAPSRRALVAAGVTIIGAATVAVGAFAGLGVWLVALVAGGLLGGLCTLMAIAVADASRGVPNRPREVMVDRVTGLPGAERLKEDLDLAFADSEGVGRAVLHLFVLKGLKRYSEAYGERCGDALLGWLARKLRDAAGDVGAAYRLRGAAFAVLASGSERFTADLRAVCLRALHEVGEGFVISAAVGSVEVPVEADTAEQALELADRRARADRSEPHGDAELRPPEDPMEVLPLERPRYDVAVIAPRIGRRIGLPLRELEDLEAAAHLRDVGNMAVPSAVLTRAGALPGHEWQFIRLHTIVGERLLASKFEMEQVARLVRSSHERWDGAGYPDGLAGDEIPLGARVVFVCTAFQDMTSARPHRPAMSAEQALAELERGAGSQFDPDVVGAFLQEFAIAHEPEAGEIARHSRQSLRVLVADDDAASRFLLQRGIDAAGHKCVAVEDGITAWKTFRRIKPDVVLCDWQLPEMSGVELCRRIRDDSTDPHTYFVILVALDSIRVRPGIVAEANQLLSKPFDRRELEAVLIKAAEQASLRRDPDS